MQKQNIKIWDNHYKQWLEPINIVFGPDNEIAKIDASFPGKEPMIDGWYTIKDKALEKIAITGVLSLNKHLLPQEERVIVPNNHMRSLELIMSENPDMLASKVIEEYKYEEQCYDAWVALQNKEVLDMERFLKDSKYVKIEYSSGRFYLLEINKTYVADGILYFDALKSTFFKRANSIEIRTLETHTFQQWDNYYSGNEKMTVLKKEEYEE